MQINVIENGSESVFDMLIFPEQNPLNLQYIQNQFGSFSNTLTDIGQSFLKKSQEIFEATQNSNAVRIAKAAMRMAKGVMRADVIQEFKTIDDVRGAQPVMQRNIMAHPELRELYHKQLIDGYSDSYMDIEPFKRAVEHSDWRRIMSGVVVDDDKGNWHATMYYDEIDAEDRALSFDEKHIILNVWDIVTQALIKEVDPTDIFAKD